jgi:NADH-quinone oxidoreductase subunit G
MFEQPRKAYVLMGSSRNLIVPIRNWLLAALKQASLVVYMSAFKHARHWNTPTSCCRLHHYTETAGTFVNTEGRVQSFNGVAKRAAMRVRPGRCFACSATC